MLDQWINVAKGFILVFAIDDQESFDAIKTMIKRIEKHDKGDLPIILVGNKCDLVNKRKISEQQGEELARSIKGKYSEQQGEELARSIKGKYYETSALTDENGNVKTVFVECAKMILDSMGSDEDDKPKCCILF